MNTTKIITDSIGYIGSALVAFSITRTSLKKLRIISFSGNLFFIVYSIIIAAYPTVLLNSFCAVVNIYNLIKLNKASKSYEIMECFKDESLVQIYLKANCEEIMSFFPNFKSDPSHESGFMITNNSLPVGLLLGSFNAENEFIIDLDYTIPAYRDCSVGDFLYKQLDEKAFASRFVYPEENSAHTKYLLNVGFEKQGNLYIRPCKTNK